MDLTEFMGLTRDKMVEELRRIDDTCVVGKTKARKDDLVKIFIQVSAVKEVTAPPEDYATTSINLKGSATNTQVVARRTFASTEVDAYVPPPQPRTEQETQDVIQQVAGLPRAHRDLLLQYSGFEGVMHNRKVRRRKQALARKIYKILPKGISLPEAVIAAVSYTP